MSSKVTRAKTSTASGSKGKAAPNKATRAKSAPPPLKVVVRRLPHAMKEEEFIAVLTAAATEAGMGERSGSWDLLYFAPGKMSKKRGKVTSTAYLHIVRGRGASADLNLMKLRAAVLASDAMVAATKDAKVNDKLAAGPAVEVAPFQKLFKLKPKRDARVGTIEKDPEYKAFCAALQSPAPLLPGADVQADIREAEGKEEPKPPNALLDFLKERGAKRMRDSQRAAALGSSAASGSSRGSRRASRSANAEASVGSSTTSVGAKLSASLSSAAAKAAAAKAAAASTPTKKINASDSSKRPVADSGKPRDNEKGELAKHKSREGGGGGGGGGGGSTSTRTARGNTSGASRPPPAPPTEKLAASNPSTGKMTGSGSGPEPKGGRSSAKGTSSGRTRSKSSGRTSGASSTPTKAAARATANPTAEPAAASISFKKRDSKANAPVALVASAAAAGATQSASPRGGGGKGDGAPSAPAGGGRRGGGSGGRGRAGGRSGGSSRSKGGGGGASGGGGGGGGGGGS